jgi:pyridoxal 5'-phosphate synthase pdxT subunit
VSSLTRLPGERLSDRATRSAHVATEPAVDDRAQDGAPVIGVLALQGDVLEHVRVLRAIGAHSLAVRSIDDLAAVDALVLPGGESTTISRLLALGGLMEPLRARIADGMPVLATCAGLILLSDELEGGEIERPGGLAVRTRRNAYGSQLASFDTSVMVRGVDGAPMDVSFIRAPRIEAVLADEVEVLAEVDGHAVVVRQGALLAMAFHPEVAGDGRLHALFVRDVVRRDAR